MIGHKYNGRGVVMVRKGEVHCLSLKRDPSFGAEDRHSLDLFVLPGVVDVSVKRSGKCDAKVDIVQPTNTRFSVDNAMAKGCLFKSITQALDDTHAWPFRLLLEGDINCEFAFKAKRDMKQWLKALELATPQGAQKCTSLTSQFNKLLKKSSPSLLPRLRPTFNSETHSAREELTYYVEPDDDQYYQEDPFDSLAENTDNDTVSLPNETNSPEQEYLLLLDSNESSEEVNEQLTPPSLSKEENSHLTPPPLPKVKSDDQISMESQDSSGVVSPVPFLTVTMADPPRFSPPVDSVSNPSDVHLLRSCSPIMLGSRSSSPNSQWLEDALQTNLQSRPRSPKDYARNRTQRRPASPTDRRQRSNSPSQRSDPRSAISHSQRSTSPIDHGSSSPRRTPLSLKLNTPRSPSPKSHHLISELPPCGPKLQTRRSPSPQYKHETRRSPSPNAHRRSPSPRQSSSRKKRVISRSPRAEQRRQNLRRHRKNEICLQPKTDDRLLSPKTDDRVLSPKKDDRLLSPVHVESPSKILLPPGSTRTLHSQFSGEQFSRLLQIHHKGSQDQQDECRQEHHRVYHELLPGAKRSDQKERNICTSI